MIEEKVMNISSEIGDKVVYAYPENGYLWDQEQGKKYLTPQETYIIEKIAVHDWRTEVWLKEVPGVAFNSVLFSNGK